MIPLTEKYRPRTLDEVIGQPHVIKGIKNVLNRYKEGKRMPHFLFIGPVGTGKTSSAECIAREYFSYRTPTVVGFEVEGLEAWRAVFLAQNAREVGVDEVRGRLKGLATLRGRRVIFLDEADGMSLQAQEALRTILEKTKTTTFIFSCNVGNNISDAIKSRCMTFKFKKIEDKDILKRLLDICKAEGYFNTKFTSEQRKALGKLVRYAHGDLRRALNTLEQFVTEEGLDYDGMLELLV